MRNVEGWPKEEEARKCMEITGRDHACLYPFAGEEVETPMGRGTLITTYSFGAIVQVHGESEIFERKKTGPVYRTRKFHPDKVFPVGVRRMT